MIICLRVLSNVLYYQRQNKSAAVCPDHGASNILVATTSSRCDNPAQLSVPVLTVGKVGTASFRLASGGSTVTTSSAKYHTSFIRMSPSFAEEIDPRFLHSKASTCNESGEFYRRAVQISQFAARQLILPDCSTAHYTKVAYALHKMAYALHKVAYAHHKGS